ncbi:hypothetical protein BD410DRAFT_806149 [Rickenella mellea]|uniref:Uncharacterized protein n=1 Tax=Rickenella mellea TaxID=50990 RepID=A0A4Y7PV22_9AGAM|nr:hypothetical protein BD410DRAFT_806149 [Rickenella mellea]
MAHANDAVLKDCLVNSRWLKADPATPMHDTTCIPRDPRERLAGEGPSQPRPRRSEFYFEIQAHIDRRSIAESSAQVIPPRQNIAISQEGPPNLLRQTTPDLPTDGLPALQAMNVANYFSPPTPPTQPVAEAPTEGYLTPQAMIVPTYFSPPTAYQSLMGGGLTYSFVTNYDIPLGSLEIPIGPLLDQYGYTAWNHTTTDGDDYAGVE